MKKIFITGLIFMAITGSSFGSSKEIRKYNFQLEISMNFETSMKECIVEVTHRDDWGNIKTTVYRTWYTNDDIGNFMCYNFALSVQKTYDPFFQYQLKKEN